MIDTRTTQRYAVDLPGRLRIGEFEVGCRIRNLSLGGIFIVGPAIMIDTRVTIRFSAPHLDGFEARCIARWNTSEGCGLRFVELRSIETYMLAKFIRHASRQTAKFPVPAIRRPAETR